MAARPSGRPLVRSHSRSAHPSALVEGPLRARCMLGHPPKEDAAISPAASAEAGMKMATVYRKLKKYGIDKKRITD